MLKLPPSRQLSASRPCAKAAARFCPSPSLASDPISTPRRRILSRGCAHAAKGHPTPAPTAKPTNSRRFTRTPRGRAQGTVKRYHVSCHGGRAPLDHPVILEGSNAEGRFSTLCGHSLRSAATAHDAPLRHSFDAYFGRIIGSHASAANSPLSLLNRRPA